MVNNFIYALEQKPVTVPDDPSTHWLFFIVGAVVLLLLIFVILGVKSSDSDFNYAVFGLLLIFVFPFAFLLAINSKSVNFYSHFAEVENGKYYLQESAPNDFVAQAAKKRALNWDGEFKGCYVIQSDLDDKDLSPGTPLRLYNYDNEILATVDENGTTATEWDYWVRNPDSPLLSGSYLERSEPLAVVNLHEYIKCGTRNNSVVDDKDF